MSLLRAKSRLRRLRSVHACGRSAVGIFSPRNEKGWYFVRDCHTSVRAGSQ